MPYTDLRFPRGFQIPEGDILTYDMGDGTQAFKTGSYQDGNQLFVVCRKGIGTGELLSLEEVEERITLSFN